jgi:hypothetical protein
MDLFWSIGPLLTEIHPITLAKFQVHLVNLLSQLFRAFSVRESELNFGSVFSINDSPEK